MNLKSSILLVGVIFPLLTTCQNRSGGPAPAIKETHMNHLANEKSPYLQQHATNPVDWYPWGEKAFQLAKSLNRPIFLSIGYSTCHWCHVMETESFEDEEVAALLNANFVAIKVDREEHPEIDHLYMMVCQTMTGSGGWPLTIVMTPDKIPFFAGTYFPKTGRGNRPGMMELLPALARAWDQQQDKIQSTVADIQSYLAAQSTPAGSGLPKDILEQTYRQFARDFDSRNGGFGNAPKFPSPQNLLFLLRYAYDYDDSSALNMVEKTLTALRYGGIFDQVGMGFHRYSTDARWLVPHFEKMLYDQALLLLAYSEAYQLTRNSRYAQTCRDIITYLTEEMEAPEGGFYSAEDADSDGEEGKFYLWTREEIKRILGPEADWVMTYFGVSEQGNYSEPGQPNNGANILHVAVDPSAFAISRGWSRDELDRQISTITKRLYQVREKRIHPEKDTKILTDWNGLVIAALAQTGMALNSPEIITEAEKTYRFVLNQCRRKDGRLLKRWIDGSADLPAQLDDYAYVIWGGITLYKATGDPDVLNSVLELAKLTVDDFWDQDQGGFFLGSESDSDVPVRLKTAYDGALPSGNSILALVMNQLGRITGDLSWIDKADRILQVFSNEITRAPRGYSGMLLALYYDRPSSREIVLVRDVKSRGSDTDFSKVRTAYLPNSVILEKTASDPSVVNLIPWLSAYTTVDEKPTYYICRNYACDQPTTSLESVLQKLTSR
ncbi:MAG: thioredoxin domain-containing protein [FCB group bacterium]|nr:thioredoxin domain-containing protein [FCB group bacterium]